MCQSDAPFLPRAQRHSCFWPQPDVRRVPADVFWLLFFIKGFSHCADTDGFVALRIGDILTWILRRIAFRPEL